MLARVESGLLEEEYESIMSFASGLSNDEVFACMLSSWQFGDGVLPSDFGLGEGGFKQLLLTHFPGMEQASLEIPMRKNDAQRDNERDEIYQLLLSHCACSSGPESASKTWMANIIAMACMGQDHLWQDLGLWSRDQLSKLMERNFPALASKNDKNMKWKKFLYKQLCITEGIYTCRAPSCEVCTDYDNCFSAED